MLSASLRRIAGDLIAGLAAIEPVSAALEPA
jgi:hypothetical protein